MAVTVDKLLGKPLMHKHKSGDITGGPFVPYTGATVDVDLGIHSLKTASLLKGIYTYTFPDKDGTFAMTSDILAEADTLATVTARENIAAGDIILKKGQKLIFDG